MAAVVVVDTGYGNINYRIISFHTSIISGMKDFIRAANAIRFETMIGSQN